MRYRQETSARIQDTDLPVDALLRCDVFCNDPNHFMLLEKYSCYITNACLSAARATISLTGPPESYDNKRVYLDGLTWWSQRDKLRFFGIICGSIAVVLLRWCGGWNNEAH